MIALELRVPDPGNEYGGTYEWVNLSLKDPLITRTRWVTQRTLQAVGTGTLMLWTCHPGWKIYLYKAPPWHLSWNSHDRAWQSAAIGFGAL